MKLLYYYYYYFCLNIVNISKLVRNTKEQIKTDFCNFYYYNGERESEREFVVYIII